MSDVLTRKDSDVSLNRERLRSILTFAKENGKYTSTWSTENLIQTETMVSRSAVLSVDNFAGVINASFYQEHLLTLSGFPGAGGTALGVSAMESAAVSSQCACPEAAVDFIRILLSSSHQNAIADKNEGIPVRRDALDVQIDNAFEMYESNPMFAYYYEMEPTQELVDRYKEICESDVMRSGQDTTVTDIIVEEAMVFFSGQGDVDTVLDKIESRIQTWQSEKG